MSISEILEAHTVKRPWSEASRMRCKCGEVMTAETEGQLYALHRAHQAQMLQEHQRARESAVLGALAALLEEYQAAHDVAEVAALVEGETGRREAIERWETILEDPAAWLQDKAVEHAGGKDELQGMQFNAWQDGALYVLDAEGYSLGSTADQYLQGNPYAEEAPGVAD